ncbi:unnamed protein product [Jaminaea pallidilutea]
MTHTPLLPIIVAAVAFAGAAQAQPVISTPTSLVSCLNAKVAWNSAKAPVHISVFEGNDLTKKPISSLPVQQQSDGSYSWKVNVKAGTVVTFQIRDDAGDTNASAQVTVQDGSDDACRGVTLVGSGSGGSTSHGSGSNSSSSDGASSHNTTSSSTAGGNTASSGTTGSSSSSTGSGSTSSTGSSTDTSSADPSTDATAAATNGTVDPMAADGNSSVNGSEPSPNAAVGVYSNKNFVGSVLVAAGVGLLGLAAHALTVA